MNLALAWNIITSLLLSCLGHGRFILGSSLLFNLFKNLYNTNLCEIKKKISQQLSRVLAIYQMLKKMRIDRQTGRKTDR
jgi:hypothetical protein